MNTFPLIRSKWSNEHIMAAVFSVLVLYMLPTWVQKPVGILNFTVILVVALFIDAVINMVKYKRPICAVSAAITAAILYILTPGISLWMQIVGIAAALLFGKHIWGGTGKNPVNPAITGILLLGLLFELKAPDFSPQLLLIPALLLSIPFIKFRPYAALGFMAGMAAAMVLRLEFGFDSFLMSGVIFWGCIVLTDPVTVSPNPVVGAAGGALTGAAAMLLSGSTVVLAASVLLFNVICFVADRYVELPARKKPVQNQIRKIIPDNNNVLFFDLSFANDEAAAVHENYEPDIEDILGRIRDNEVLGLGGAAFPAITKIKTVMETDVEKKYLIVNGVECDPGLIHDHWLMNRSMDEICRGIKLLRKCIDFETVSLAVKETTDIQACEANVAKVPDYYPVGAEKALIKHVLGIELQSSDIPAKKGILVLNVQTVFAIYEAVIRNIRADTKLITVADLKSGTGYVVRARLGTAIQSIVQKLPLAQGNLFVGGGAMQSRNGSDEELIDEKVNFVAISNFPKYKESVLCSRCGFCAANCPMGIRVDCISQLTEQDELAKTQKYHPEKCIQCGNCSRVCLAGRNLAMRVKMAKEAAYGA